MSEKGKSIENVNVAFVRVVHVRKLAVNQKFVAQLTEPRGELHTSYTYTIPT
jgi:hypothetical protein